MVLARRRTTESTSWGCFCGAEPRQIPIDSNGNLNTKTEGTDSWGYEWNARDELTRVTKNSVEQARFSYDPIGRRVEKVAGGVTTSYTYDAEAVLREMRGSAVLRYVQGLGMDEPLAVEDSSGSLGYYHADWLGSIVKRTSQSGAVAHEYRYDAWGNIELGATEPGYSFTGREWDPETKLYYYRARYYDANVGRFTGEDPAGLADGPNRYTYVRNKPADRIDPTGRLTKAERKYCRDFRNFQACTTGVMCMLEAELDYGHSDNDPQNASKHCWWACCIAKQSGAAAAYDITTAHEAGPGDRCEKQMDKANNAAGIAFGRANPDTSCRVLCDPKRLQCQPKQPPCF